jgi:hypothetical protein
LGLRGIFERKREEGRWEGGKVGKWGRFEEWGGLSVLFLLFHVHTCYFHTSSGKVGRWEGGGGLKSGEV